MSGARSLKNAERRLLRALAGPARAFLRGFGSGLRRVAHGLGERFTVVVLPVDHRPLFQLSMSAGRFLFILFLLIDGSIALPILHSRILRNREALVAAASLAETRGDEESAFRESLSDLAAESVPFTAALDRVDSILSRDNRGEKSGAASLLEIFGLDTRRRGNPSDLDRLIGLRRTLDESAALIQEAGRVAGNTRGNVDEVPVLWPLKGGIGHVSMPFGPNPNPFTGIPYFHLGMDIGNYRDGDAIIATADGVVAAAYYDSVSGYGNNVILQHPHGYYTRYGHMMSIRVTVGQRVSRGQVIGYVGHTGRVDGPHVHYEMHLGGQLLDPASMMLSP